MHICDQGNNGGCDHICSKDGDQATCSCSVNYLLADDGLTCDKSMYYIINNLFVTIYPITKSLKNFMYHWMAWSFIIFMSKKKKIEFDENTFRRLTTSKYVLFYFSPWMWFTTQRPLFSIVCQERRIFHMCLQWKIYIV